MYIHARTAIRAAKVRKKIHIYKYIWEIMLFLKKIIVKMPFFAEKIVIIAMQRV